MNKVEAKLNIYFALMACLCGLTFLGTPELAGLPWLAIFFAMFGLVFVDLLKWFALPATMAYISLGAIAFYTINRFLTIGAMAAEPQMIAVAELLVLVQSVLMLQRKNRRIYEQLAVFALLELIVAAIFNNALSYGLLLLPLGMVAVGALSLLHVYTTSEDAFTDSQTQGGTLKVCSAQSRQSFIDVSSPLPRLGMLTIAPSALVVAMVFFYALPRTNKDARAGLGGKAQVGFNSEVRLGQIGQMMLNPEVAARLEIADRKTGLRYDVVGDIYLRGAVLEAYGNSSLSYGTWTTTENDPELMPRQLPSSQLSQRPSERTLNDELTVKVSVSPMRSESLFSLPPYYSDATGPKVAHVKDRWVLARRTRSVSNRESQISYRFATQGFRNGEQLRFIPRFASEEDPEFSVVKPQDLAQMEDQTTGNGIDAFLAKTSEFIRRNSEGATAQSDAVGGSEEQIGDLAALPQDVAASDREWELEREAAILRSQRQKSAASYVQACLTYDDEEVPSAKAISRTIVNAMRANRDSPLQQALEMESFLTSESEYKYSLNLTNDTIPGMDPIEQFLSIDKKGNCQYFAAALVLMLRSQGIPARLVVGFSTDEYNNIGGYYVARQLHAHAWVEALIDAQWLRPKDMVYSSTPASQYWMRLDPTPGGGGSGRSAGGRVSDVLDMAQGIWTSYVVEADGSSRRRELGISGNEMSGSYELFYEWLKLKVSRVRAGELGAGSLADREIFSWPSALLGIVLSLAAFAAYQFGLSHWLGGSAKFDTQVEAPDRPAIAYFAETLALLERLGFHRRAGQTPKELTAQVADGPIPRLASPLGELTRAYYRERFASDAVPASEASDGGNNAAVEQALAELRREVESQGRENLGKGESNG
jgi:protein-glutamine gamma-glutamyltransferase